MGFKVHSHLSSMGEFLTRQVDAGSKTQLYQRQKGKHMAQFVGCACFNGRDWKHNETVPLRASTISRFNKKYITNECLKCTPFTFPHKTSKQGR